MDEVY